MREVRGVLIKQEAGKNEIKEYIHIDKSFRDLYPLLNCRVFEVVTRKIGKSYYDIWCDDMGLFDESKKPTVVTLDEEGNVVEQIVGNCFICKNEEGEMSGLNEKEVAEVLHSAQKWFFRCEENVFENECVTASL